MLSSTSKNVQAQTSNTIFEAVEQEATFPGGEYAMLNYLANRIRYPKMAATAGIVGMVYVDFVVNKDGSISDCKVKRDIGGGCGAEVVRVVKQMPHWQAAKNNGKAVRSRFTLPVKFSEPEKLSRKKMRQERRSLRKEKRKKQ